MIIIARGLVSEKEVLSNADGSSYSHRQQTLRSLYVGVPTSDNDSRSRPRLVDTRNDSLLLRSSIREMFYTFQNRVTSCHAQTARVGLKVPRRQHGSSPSRQDGACKTASTR
jgi:hypothetical protein